MTVNLANETASDTGGIENITAVIGSSSTDNTLVGANFSNTWNITGTDAGTVGGFSFSAIANLTGGSGSDSFDFGPAGSITGIVNGAGGSNTLDYATNGGQAVTVNLATGAASDTGGVSNISSFVGGSGSNTLIGPNTALTWQLTALNSGTAGSVAFSAFENLVGGSGVNSFQIFNGAGVSGSIDGGSGSSNYIGYGNWTTGVTVNLTTGVATGIAGGISGFNIINGSPYADHLTGGPGIDIIRGNGGNDTITGGSGDDILIGGSGTCQITSGSGRSILIADTGAGDTLTGGAAGDILIAGSTSYDGNTTANDQALLDILAEWDSSDSYVTRIAKIRSGVGTGAELGDGDHPGGRHAQRPAEQPERPELVLGQDRLGDRRPGCRQQTGQLRIGRLLHTRIAGPGPLELPMPRQCDSEPFTNVVRELPQSESS